ncbi:MAG TPA: adenylate/guanylate cyclase domain-containing protein [Actinomycetota bacterium]|nr:adenylate/guanylate cyclase domain-containing protein [Actinomycetota bacterium]
MNDHDLTEAGAAASAPASPRGATAGDAKASSKIIEFPVHRRGSLADTLSGFPERDDGPQWNGTRNERELTLVVAELRGYAAIAERHGVPSAAVEIASAVEAAVETLRARGGEQVAVGGRADQPVAWAEFAGEAHAEAAVAAAVALRDGVDRSADGIRACVGLNSGHVVDTVVEGVTPVAYRAMGTLRMFAVRLQEFAGPGQIFASASTVAALQTGTAGFRSIGPVRTNAGGETAEAYSLLELSPPASRPGASGAIG